MLLSSSSLLSYVLHIQHIFASCVCVCMYSEKRERGLVCMHGLAFALVSMIHTTCVPYLCLWERKRPQVRFIFKLMVGTIFELCRCVQFVCYTVHVHVFVYLGLFLVIRFLCMCVCVFVCARSLHKSFSLARLSLCHERAAGVNHKLSQFARYLPTNSSSSVFFFLLYFPR